MFLPQLSFDLYLHGITFFITSSLYVFLDLNWVSCREPIFRSCFCIHSVGLCHLVGAFNSFLFKVIIDVYIFTFILLLVCKSFYFPSSFILLWFVGIFSVVFKLLFIFFMCIYCRFLICKCMRFLYNCLHIYKIVLSF